MLVVTYSFLVVEGEVLGTFGWFSRWPLAVTSVLVAVAVEVASRVRRSAAPPAEGAADADGSPVTLPYRSGFWHQVPSYAASVCGALVLAQALVAIWATARTGNLFVDSLQYHLTYAAHFATTHHTGGTIQIAPGLAMSYYPLNGELLHGMGIALLHRDSLSLLLGVADIGALLLGAWCVGSAFGVGPVALCSVTPLVALLGAFDASAINDWTAVWPFVAVLALAVHYRKEAEQAPIGIAFAVGLAGGLAMGSKLSMLAPTLALLLGFLVLVGRARLARATLLVVVGGGLTASYWYFRNAIDVGSPFPSQHVPGLDRVPMSAIDRYGFSVAHYLTNGSVIRHFVVPGFHFFLGRAWLAILLLAVIGVIVSGRYGPSGLRMASIVAVIATGAYLVTPAGAFGPAGHPYLLEYNVRYALPALALGLLAMGASGIAVRWACAVAAVFAATLIVTLTGHRMWALGHGATLAAIVVALAVVAVLRLPQVRRHAPVIVAAVVVVGVIGGYSANQRYLKDRYHGHKQAKEALYRSLQAQSGVKIGVVGAAIYPFLGSTYDNTAEYLGQTEADHAFVDYSTCSSWRGAVAAGRYDFVVIEISPGSPPPPALEWTATDSAAQEILRNSAGAVFAVGPGFGTEPCASSQSGSAETASTIEE